MHMHTNIVTMCVYGTYITHTHTHTVGVATSAQREVSLTESPIRDIQAHAMITRQMNTWQQRSLRGRTLWNSGMEWCVEQRTWENRLRVSHRVSASRVTLETLWNTRYRVASKTNVSLGINLEIGYCIAEATYLFWGLTYLIPSLIPLELMPSHFQLSN